MSIVRKAFGQFHNALQKWPLRTQMITGGTLTFLGDVIAQQGIEKRTFDEHDWVRSARMGFFAVIVWTGVGYKWYFSIIKNKIEITKKKILRFTLAEKWFPGNSWQMMVKKLAIDQIIVVPCLLVAFFAMNEGLQGNGISGFKSRINEDYTTVMVKNWSLWTPAQFINFYLIPLLYRVIFTRVISFFWNIYLSWKAHEAH